MKSNKFLKILKSAVPLIVICLSVSLVLSLTNRITAERISRLEEQKRNEAMSRIFDCDQFLPINTEITDNRINDVYVAGNFGFVVTVTTGGYGGDVTVMVGVNTDGTVKAVEILDVSSETVGLGQNAAKPEFHSAFAGKGRNISVTKGEPGDNEIKAITGATITSQAVTDAVNIATDFAAEHLLKEGGDAE